jgi:hypothetical protein
MAFIISTMASLLASKEGTSFFPAQDRPKSMYMYAHGIGTTSIPTCRVNGRSNLNSHRWYWHSHCCQEMWL